MIVLRGATTISENTEAEIENASIELFSEIIKLNNIDLDNILSIEISCTKDINKAYPGKFIREHFKLNHIAIMHFNEMEVDKTLNGYIPLCIRFLIWADLRNTNNKFVYLKGAKKLRKDLLSE